MRAPSTAPKPKVLRSERVQGVPRGELGQRRQHPAPSLGTDRSRSPQQTLLALRRQALAADATASGPECVQGARAIRPDR